MSEPIRDAETAVRELGALPMPSGPARLTPEQRAKIAEQIGDVQPATPGLLAAFGQSVLNRREHQHPEWEDLFCMNLSSWMGERMAPVLRRLIDAEAEIDALKTAQEKSSREADATPTDFFGPGRVYVRDLPFRAPEDTLQFECVGIGAHPSKDGALRAFGFERPGAGRPWVSASQRAEEWAEGWVDLGPVRPDGLTRTFAAVQALREDEASEPALTIYCAVWDTVPLGQYTSESEARRHAEDHARRDLPTGAFDWIVDEEDGVAELVATVDGDEGPTGYVVTALEIASKYDPEAEE
ncbi:hypothetical protein ACGFZS_09620 [Streptomyces sp. NPDC048288]|uniref:hypothetical protein n=1 Tax=Streptomyces sp. NPDC048288 TaxID=3365529 RepID=UPI003712051F